MIANTLINLKYKDQCINQGSAEKQNQDVCVCVYIYMYIYIYGGEILID